MVKLHKTGYFFIMFLSMFLLFGAWSVGATPEKDEGPVEKESLEDTPQSMDEVQPEAFSAKEKENTFKVFLDPGHGGKDTGATSNGLKEKDVVLDIALETKKVLDKEYEGVETKISRDSDRFVELTDRAKQANDWGADYFASFHLNSLDGSASGFESYIYNGDVSEETKTRQNHIHSYLADRIDVKDRGRKSANYSVLRNTSMSSILLEYMFIDDSSENELLQKESYRKQLGKLTAKSIADTYDLSKK